MVENLSSFIPLPMSVFPDKPSRLAVVAVDSIAGENVDNCQGNRVLGNVPDPLACCRHFRRSDFYIPARVVKPGRPFAVLDIEIVLIAVDGHGAHLPRRSWLSSTAIRAQWITQS